MGKLLKGEQSIDAVIGPACNSVCPCMAGPWTVLAGPWMAGPCMAPKQVVSCRYAR